MRVREWDPATASTAEVAAVVRTMNQVLTVDLPDDPLWQEDRFREYLAVTMPGERRVTWLAYADDAGEGGDGDPVGHATVLLMDDIGVLELFVRPSARRRRVGSGLLATAAHRAAREGYGSLGVEVVGGTPSVAFYEALGFRCAYTELRAVLPLSDVDWQRVAAMAAGIGAGYRLEFHPGGPPPELFAEYAAAKEAVRHLESDDLDLRPSSYDPERLAASLRTLHARGLKPYIVLAIHERSGSVAGLTEVVVPAQRPTRADQYDTIVVPAHHGYGVGRAMKARMLFELQESEPNLAYVQTWNALENAGMLQINADLGFRQDREWREYEADVADLVRRLPEPPRTLDAPAST